MTKVSETRSALRHLTLTKAADAYSEMLNSYANAHRPGLVGAGVRVATNDALKRQGYSVPKTVQAPPAKAPLIPAKYQGQGGLRTMLDDTLAEGKVNLRTRLAQLKQFFATRPSMPTKAPTVVGSTATLTGR